MNRRPSQRWRRAREGSGIGFGRGPLTAWSRVGWSRMGGGAAVGMVLGLTGCTEPQPPRIVAQLGCNVDEGLISTLRVEARGDFPPRGGTQVLFSDGEQNLAWGGLPVDAVTVEGLFGQTVEAVGRTARLRDEGDIPVYFAPVDGVCPVRGEVVPRVEVEVAVGDEGDVLAVGGLDVEGRALDDVIYLHDEDGRVRRLPGALPLPSVGHSVHAIEGRRFVVFGGAGGGETALDQVLVVDVLDERNPIGNPRPTGLSLEAGPARAFHAGARLPSGRILVAGGCRRLNPERRCSAIEDGAFDDPDVPDVPGNALWIDGGGASVVVSVGPDLVVPRFDAELLVARDGVVFLAGGRDADGMPVHIVERLRPDTSRFRRYGGDLRADLDDDMAIVGAALHDGGVVLLALADGRIHWITEQERDEYRPWAGWCGEGEPCFTDLGAPAPATTRGMLTLAGERVLTDGLLLPVAGIGRAGVDGVDLFAPRPGVPDPPRARVGSVPVMLADGSVLLMGGHDPLTGLPSSPLALRVRPDLDGADERIPEVDRAARGSLIARDPERAVLEGETLRLLAIDEATDPFPRVRVRARGFRSSSFRFEVTAQVVQGQVVPNLVLEHGGVEAISVSLEADRVIGHLRDPQGRQQDVSCAATGLDFSQAQVLRFDVEPDAILVRRGGEVLAQCPVLGEPREWSVGLGAAGSGDLRVSGLRLTRQ